MFTVIYKWKLKQGSETVFQRAWAQRTKEVASQLGGLGSRLHSADDGTWIAYAQWPSREAWESAGKLPPVETEARKIMNEATESFEVLFRLEVVEDLLKRI